MTGNDIRRKILEMVFARFKEHPYHRITPKEFMETLHIKLSELNFHAVYLEEKGFLELQKPLEGNVFVGARITPQGIDLYEDEYRFDASFPAEGERKPVPGNIFLALDELAAGIQKSQTAKVDDIDIVNHSIEAIKRELRNDAPRYSVIKKHVGVIRKKCPSMAEEVIRLLKSPSVTRILRDSLWT